MLIETLFVEESSFAATLNPESRSKCAQLVAIAATAQDARQVCFGPLCCQHTTL